MKIAHVTIYPPKGEKHISSSGVASYSKNLVTSIPSGDQTVICDQINGPETYDEDGVSVRRVFRKSPGFIFSINKELERLQPDVIHIQQELALFGGILTAYLLQWLVFWWRDRTVITLHGVVDPAAIDEAFVRENNSRLPVWLVRLAFRIIYTPLMKRAKHIIVHEQFFKDIITRSYRIGGGKVSVIPHGIETFEAQDQAKARGELKLPAQADIALFMGYATGYKGIDLLIEGFSEYAKKNPSTYLVIGAGKHPKLHDDPTYLAEYERLQQKAGQLIPAGRYEWRGFIDEHDIAAYYSVSDVSLYPYTTAMSSSGPMSFAIGYEKPFLVSDAFEGIFGAYPQLLFKRSGSALAEKLDYFFTHRDEYADVSYFLKQQRTWQSVGAKTCTVYQTTHNQKGLYEESAPVG